MFHGDISCTVSVITWSLDKYGHFNDVILNWHHAGIVNRWRHTYTILIIAHVPMLFYVKKLLTYKYKNRADCIHGIYMYQGCN